MSDRGVNEAQEKRLIFSNLANGVPLSHVMEAFQKSEKEVMDIFKFVARKIQSYRFERGMPWAQSDSINAAIKNNVLLQHTLARVNLGTDAKFKDFATYELDPTKPLSEGEQRLLSLQSRMRK